MHLSPQMYHLAQYITCGNYGDTLKKLYEFLNIKSGDVVIELGSGDGGFSKYLIQKGCKYYGIDLDKDRVKIAKQKEPGANFIAADLLNFDFTTLPSSTKYFCHGVLHHLDDSKCKELFKKVTSIREYIQFVAIEPVRPDRWYTNPVGTLISNMDEGNYVRTLNSWSELFQPWLKKMDVLSRMPRWPIPAVFALLVGKQ